MASFLPVLDKSGSFERPNDLPRRQRRELGHESSRNRHGNGYPPVERWTFLGNLFPVIRQALQVQRDSFLDVPLGLFQGFTLGVTTGQSGDGRHVAAFRRLFVKNRIGKRPGNLTRHRLHCRMPQLNRQRELLSRLETPRPSGDLRAFLFHLILKLHALRLSRLFSILVRVYHLKPSEWRWRNSSFQRKQPTRKSGFFVAIYSF